VREWRFDACDVRCLADAAGGNPVGENGAMDTPEVERAITATTEPWERTLGSLSMR
jgi:hypothetical protein